MCFLVVSDHIDYKREKRVEVSVSLPKRRHVAVVDIYWELQKLLNEPKLFALDKFDKAQTRIRSGFHIEVKYFISQVHQMSNNSGH